ncbi:MAG: hypothetical protein EXR79_13645 [Myxococcales bacterium]|nr:hypothetical protein [Myxococcales bacterium]
MKIHCIGIALACAGASLGCNVEVPTASQFDDDVADAGDATADAGTADTDPVAPDTVGVATEPADVGAPCPGGCDDQNPCTSDKCGAAGACEHAVADGGSCDDGNACTAGEGCLGSKCLGGKAKPCDDTNACTADACLPAQGCTHTDDDGAGCDDNDACTQNDKCLTGKCGGAALTCGADDCNTAKCLNGKCSAASKIAGLKCDDGDACTSSTKCNGNGLCAGGEITPCDDKNTCTDDSCDSKDGCQHAPTAAVCSDNDACTVGDACTSGTCKAGTVKLCDDGNGCTGDTCNPVDGACAVTPTAAPCSDGNGCTVGDTCSKGACVPGVVVGCDDANPCTVDSCNAGTGVCGHIQGSGACDDGDGCTVGDACLDGACAGGATKLCGDKDTCTADNCDAATGACINKPIAGCGATCQTAAECKAGDLCNAVACLSGKCAFLPTSAVCDDGDACSVGDTCQGGTCKGGTDKNCDDGNPCTDDSCSKGTCASTANAAPCSDNDACTQGDACAGGKCGAGSPKPCDDGNPCTTDGCDPQAGTCASANNAAVCDDKNPCTLGDACKAGACTAGAGVNCDDGSACTNDACDTKTGKCVTNNNSSPCSDGNACTQGDGCDGGTCVVGVAKSCDDANPCSNDSCDIVTAACQNLANAAICTDGDACSIGDGCAGGACKKGAAKVCADNDTCTNDLCDSASGNCVFKAITGCGGNCSPASDCKDGNVCTADSCVGGKCAFPANTAACDDGNACTLGDMCANGGCKPGAAKSCDDGKPCTDDACVLQTGACGNVANTAPCDDGNACTAGDACAASQCKAGKATDCNDGNPCSDDACDPQSGACKSAANVAPCSDGNACTVSDVCGAGVCKPGATKGCDDNNGCTNDGCDVSQGTCTHVANTSACNDANECTLGDQCAATSCKSGAPKSCDDGKQCTDDGCDKASGNCAYAANAAACDDGNKCTLADKCALGACAPGTLVACDDKDACTNDSCNPASGTCLFSPKVGCGGNCAKAIDCSDGNACTTDECTSGKCAFPANTASCDDANPCTVSDVCASGTCKPGAPKPCDDGNPCTNDSCNASIGQCAYVNNTAPCNDNNACTLGDACAASKCAGGAPKACNDSNGCTDDGCAPLTGLCAFANNATACSDNSACTTLDGCSGGTCKGGPPLACDDNNLCTTDSCDPGSGCKKVNNTSPCSDGNACTMADACSAGACKGMPTLPCDDGKLCTMDTCEPGSGCKYTSIVVGCTDGNACTLNDGCANGTCQAGALKGCNDNDNCSNDSCDPASGNCVFKAIIGCGGNCATNGDCSDNNGCTVDMCTTGKCANAPSPAACSDGNACTLNDVCASGLCNGGLPPNCDDNQPCTSDNCEPVAGCKHGTNTLSCNDNNACSTGDLCANGSCKGGAPPNCDDGNTCTTDSCEPAHGCKHVAGTFACDDGNACTQNDACGNGTCSGSQVVCIDNKVCTDDSCNAQTGCEYSLQSGAPCDDGDVCSVGDSCQNGTCTPGQQVWVDKIAGVVPVPNQGFNGGGNANGQGGNAKFNTPKGLAYVVKPGALFVADAANHSIRKVTPQGAVTTFAGNGLQGAGDGTGAQASFNGPEGIAADEKGTLFVADTQNCLIRMVGDDGKVTTQTGMAGCGFANGKLGEAKFLYPKGIAWNNSGLIAVADTGNHAIRLVQLGTGLVTTLAGVGGKEGGFADGSGINAKFNQPSALAFDTTGALFVADTSNHLIRKVTPDGTVTTIGGDGIAGFKDSLDPSTAQFHYPTGIAATVGYSGTILYIADSYNARIRRVSGGGVVTTFAGGGTAGPANGPASSVSFYLPVGLAVDDSGYVFVADSYHHVVRRIRDTSSPCAIDEKCYVGGIWNPSNSCQECAGKGAKSWSAKDPGGACDDGDKCTENEKCLTTGGCSANLLQCDDDIKCTIDSCDGVTGACVHVQSAGCGG